MKRCFSLLAAFLFTSLLSGEQTPGRTTLIVHVNVVPMSSDQVVRDQSVLIEDGKIKAIFRKVKPEEHVDQVLAAVEEIGA